MVAAASEVPAGMGQFGTLFLHTQAFRKFDRILAGRQQGSENRVDSVGIIQHSRSNLEVPLKDKRRQADEYRGNPEHGGKAAHRDEQEDDQYDWQHDVLDTRKPKQCETQQPQQTQINPEAALQDHCSGSANRQVSTEYCAEFGIQAIGKQGVEGVTQNGCKNHGMGESAKW
jgi:hypothetical protein